MRTVARRACGSAAILFIFAALACGFGVYYLALANELLPGVVEVNNPLDPFRVQMMLEYWTAYSLLLGLLFSCAWLWSVSGLPYPRFRLRTWVTFFAFLATAIFLTSSDLPLLFWKSYPLSGTATISLLLMALALVVWFLVRKKRPHLPVVPS